MRARRFNTPQVGQEKRIATMLKLAFVCVIPVQFYCISYMSIYEDVIKPDAMSLFLSRSKDFGKASRTIIEDAPAPDTTSRVALVFSSSEQEERVEEVHRLGEEEQAGLKAEPEEQVRLRAEQDMFRLHLEREEQALVALEADMLREDQVRLQAEQEELARLKAEQETIIIRQEEEARMQAEQQEKALLEALEADKDKRVVREKEEQARLMAAKDASKANFVIEDAPEEITAIAARSLDGSADLGHAETRYLLNTNEHHKQSQCPRDRNIVTSTTLVTQTTLDRLQLLLITCQRWNSPIITVVYVTASEFESSWSRISEEYIEKCSHLKLIPYVAISHVERTRAYPINKLRNIGLDHVMTSHILLIDADFIPSVGLEMGAQKAIDEVKEEARYALVVPAYERVINSSGCEDLERCSEFMPRSMASLTKCVNRERCIVFHSDYFPPGHGNTNSEQWLHDMNESKVRPIPCTHDKYEPYVVIPWCPTTEDTDAAVEGEDRWKPKSPYYDERFYGYGLNKVQHLKHLEARGYLFGVIPALGFLTHHPHQVSRTKEKWKREEGKEGLRWKMLLMFRQFQEELGREYRNPKVRKVICEVA